MENSADPWATLVAQTPAPPQPAPQPDTSAQQQESPEEKDPWSTLVGAPAPAQSANPAPAETDPWHALVSEPSPEPGKQPKPAPKGVVGKAWDFINRPLADPHDLANEMFSGPLASAGQYSPYEMGSAFLEQLAKNSSGTSQRIYQSLEGAKKGGEQFLASLTSPLSVGLLVATGGASAAEGVLTKAGLSSAQAAGYVQKAKLLTDFGFLSKYGFDLGSNTLPAIETAWNDVRAAKNDREKSEAVEQLSELATEGVLGAVASGMALKGVSSDLAEIHSASPKGRAMLHDQYADSVYALSAKRRAAAGEADAYERAINELVPDADRQAAIYHNIEAGGDPAVLEERARKAEAAGNTKLAEEIRAGVELNDRERIVRGQVQEIMQMNGNDLRASGRLPPESESSKYLPHKYAHDYLDPVTKKPVPGMAGQEGFLQKRVYDNIVDAELNGLAPIKNLAGLVADYHENAGNVLAKDAYSEALARGRTNDGAPMAAPQKLRRGGVLGAHDAPIDANELEQLQASGNFEKLVESGRVYESPDPPEDVAPATPKEAAEQGGGVFRGAKEGLVEITLPPELADKLESLDPRMRKFVSVTLPEKGLTPDAVLDALNKKFVEMGGRPEDALPPIERPKQFMWRQTDYEPSGAPYTVTGLNVWRDGQRVPLALNPEIAPHAQGLLEQANPSRLAKFALRASSGAKAAILSLSPFHWETMANRMFELFKNPFQRPQVDFLHPSPELEAGLRDGLMLGGRGMGRAAEGVAPSRDSFINKIPLVGGLNRLIEENLFGSSGYISGLKVEAYASLKDAIQKSRPDLSDIEAGRVAAAQVNNKFGGLNYDVLGRGANTQNALRLMLLAPDFLESSGRSILDIAGPYGGSLVKRFVAFQAAHYLAARAINYVVSGETHPEMGFNVKSADGKREYSLRTTLGDFLHFVEKPLDFVANRINPLARAAAEDFYGVDQQGHKVTAEQKFFDTLRQITPIPVQAIFPNQQVTQPSAADKLLQSVGVGSRKQYSPAETLAHTLQSERTGEGAPLEGDELESAQRRYQLEDKLRSAIVAHDNVARQQAIAQIHQDSAGQNPKITPEEASKMIEQANKYPLPLQASVNHLALADALQVWDKASLEEKRAIRPVIQAKIQKWMLASNKHTREQNDSMRQRIQAFHFSLAG